MYKISIMVLRALLPIFIGMTVMGVLIFELIDFFVNISSYLSSNISIPQVLWIMILYIPRCITYSIPLALLFSTAFVISNMYMNNEMIVIHTSGIPFLKFIRPLLIMAAIMSIGFFFFDNVFAIRTLREKNRLNTEYFGESTLVSDDIPVIIAAAGQIIYIADSFDERNALLTNLSIIIRDEAGSLLRRIDSELATWEEERSLWILKDARIFEVQADKSIEESTVRVYSDERISEEPATFLRRVRSIDDLTIQESIEYVRFLHKAGLPFQEAEVDLHQRFSFALTPLIVVIISSSLAGWFKKNTLTMNILASVAIAVLYYIFRLVTGLFAVNNYIPTYVGGWFAVIFFGILSFFILIKTPT